MDVPPGQHCHCNCRGHDPVNGLEDGRAVTCSDAGMPEAIPTLQEDKVQRLIDDFADAGLQAPGGGRWRGFSDRVMGGVSVETIARESWGGRWWLRLRGRVSLENNGGFVQMALDLAPDGRPVDVSEWTGLRLLVRGNGETYGLHLRTEDCTRPWQSYRATFEALPDPRWIDLPFSGFAAYRLEPPLDLCRVRRIGLVAIGRAFDADLALGSISLYASRP